MSLAFVVQEKNTNIVVGLYKKAKSSPIKAKVKQDQEDESTVNYG